MGEADLPKTEGAKLIDEIEAFLQKSGMGAGTFGKRSMNSASFVDALRGGRVPRIKTVQIVRDFIRDWPGDRAALISRWKGFIEVEKDGQPKELPPGLSHAEFRALVRLGTVRPSGDSMFNMPCQTFRVVGD